jgi:hypothetical protein
MREIRSYGSVGERGGNELLYLDINLEGLKKNLENFELNIPEDFKLASAEGVNNKKEREIRNSYVTLIINNSK